jgi:transcriptional antiterminator RfaH
MDGVVTALRRWHLVFTKPAAEELAKEHLERQGYGVYFPRVQQKALRRGKLVERVVSLFPRYLFVQLDTAWQSLAPVRSTVGITNVVRFGTEYTVVADGVISNLKSHEDPSSGLHSLAISPWFKSGDSVRIATGTLAGLEGVFEFKDGNQRVTIFLNLLGRESRLRIDVGCILPSAA